MAAGCIVYAYATHFNGNSAKATRGVRSLGYFTCECIKSNGEWKFLHVQHFDMGPQRTAVEKAVALGLGHDPG